ncbi:MAG: hypothetical protein PVF15_02385 [Candidatus Bathyarchaeota archaeon]|jgi:hypothetical protein
MVSKRQGKPMMQEILERYSLVEKNPRLCKRPPSEQDLKTKFVVPMLQALNWDVYDFNQVREQKNFFGLLPDYELRDDHDKIILVEVKPTSAYDKLRNDLKKYSDSPEVRKEAAIVLLTTFKDSRICTLGKKKGVRTLEISCAHYISDFDKLWNYLSNSEEGFKTRTYEKALAPRRR